MTAVRNVVFDTSHFAVRKPVIRHGAQLDTREDLDDADRCGSLDGDERWPSWTQDGRVVFSHRPHPLAPWRLHVVAAVYRKQERAAGFASDQRHDLAAGHSAG